MPATVGIALVPAGKYSAAVPKSAPRLAEFITSGAASAPSVTCLAVAGEYWQIAANGDIWVIFGAAPVAVKGSGFFQPSGSVLNYETVAGDKCAVIDNS